MTLDAWQALIGISRVDRKIEYKERWYRQISENLASIQAVRFDRTSVCGGNNQTDVRLEELAIKSKEIGELKRTRRFMMNLIEETFDEIEDNVYVEVLMQHHLFGKNCPEIAEQLSYSRSYMYKLLRRAEREYKEVSKKDTK